MYYIMEHNTTLTGKFMYFQDEPEGYDGDLWRTGAALSPAPPKMTLISRDTRTQVLSDNLLNMSDLQVYSPKMREVLASAGVDNIQYFPIKLALSKKGPVREDYQLANIVGRIACVDMDHAEIRRSSKGTILNVEEFSLLEDKIVPLPKKKSPPLIFRLDELEFLILAHESIKKAVESNGITGIKFTKTQDYVG